MQIINYFFAVANALIAVILVSLFLLGGGWVLLLTVPLHLIAAHASWFLGRNFNSFELRYRSYMYGLDGELVEVTRYDGQPVPNADVVIDGHGNVELRIFDDEPVEVTHCASEHPYRREVTN